MEQEHENPRFSHASALLAAFLVPVLIGLVAVFLGGCNPAASETPTGPEKPATLKDSLAGFWFPCETLFNHPEYNQDCRLVDDDGLYFAPGNRAYSTDGALWYDKAVRKSLDRDTLSFDIKAKTLYAYVDDSVDYVLKGDTMAYEERDRWTGEAEHHEDLVNLDGEYLTVRIQKENYDPRRFRKYSGTLRVVSMAEYTRLLRDMQ